MIFQILILLINLGPGYKSDAIFDLSKMQPYSVPDLLSCFLDITDSLVLYLPRTSDLRQLVNHVRDQSKICVIHYCVEGASKVSHNR